MSCWNNVVPGAVTPSISQRGQRAHENLSRGRGRSEKQNKNDYSARRAKRHLAQRLGKKTKKQKQTTTLATRVYTSHSD